MGVMKKKSHFRIKLCTHKWKTHQSASGVGALVSEFASFDSNSGFETVLTLVEVGDV